MASEHDNQILIPESFTQIYTDAQRGRLTVTKDELLQRYELCEDMANLLTERTSEQWFKTGWEKAEVLEQVRLGLMGEQAIVSEDEGHWAVRRLEELLGW